MSRVSERINGKAEMKMHSKGSLLILTCYLDGSNYGSLCGCTGSGEHSTNDNSSKKLHGQDIGNLKRERQMTRVVEC